MLDQQNAPNVYILQGSYTKSIIPNKGITMKANKMITLKIFNNKLFLPVFLTYPFSLEAIKKLVKKEIIIK